MALSHIHKYLSKVRWAKIFLNKINLHRSSVPPSLRQMNEGGEKNSVLFHTHSLSGGWSFFAVLTYRLHQTYWESLWHHLYSIRMSEFWVWWKYTILWSSSGDSYMLRVENNCCRLIIIALILIINSQECLLWAL